MENYQHTSRQAFFAMLSNETRMDAEILALAYEFGEEGFTCSQLEARTNRTHQSVSANITRLKDKGRLEDTGRRGRTDSNRPAIIWKLVFEDVTTEL